MKRGPSLANWDTVLDVYHSSWSEAPEEQASRLLSMLSVHRPRVLDLGCGNGRHTKWLGDSGASVTGLDLSQYAVTTTRRKTANLKAATTVRATFSALPFPDQSFDGALAYCALSHGRRDDCERAVLEVIRVLKIGGWAVFYLLSDEDFRFGSGVCVDDNTYRFSTGPEAGIEHYFFPRAAIASLLRGRHHLVWNLDREPVTESHPHYQPCARGQQRPEFTYHDLTLRRCE